MFIGVIELVIYIGMFGIVLIVGIDVGSGVIIMISKLVDKDMFL